MLAPGAGRDALPAAGVQVLLCCWCGVQPVAIAAPRQSHGRFGGNWAVPEREWRGQPLALEWLCSRWRERGEAAAGARMARASTRRKSVVRSRGGRSE